MPSSVWISYRPEIGNCFASNFKTIFSSYSLVQNEELLSLFDNCISDEENASIYAIPLEHEIISTLFSIGSTKAPGLDGFTALFCKKYWSIIKDVVLASIWEFFENNHLLKEQNHTFIALIPK